MRRPPPEATLTLSTELEPAEPAAATSAPAATGERVPLATLLAWGPPIFGLSSALFFLQFFFLKFATDVLLIAPVVVGALFAAGRLWDAGSDPIVGTFSDRTRTPLGRRRPWMFAAIPMLVVFTWMIWETVRHSPPVGGQERMMNFW